MRENPGGLVHANHIHMTPYLDSGPAGGKIVDEHNVESQNLERMAERYHRATLRPYARLQARRMRVFETAAIGRADRVLAVSDEDRRRLESMAPQARVQVVPNGVDPEYFTPGPGETPPDPGRLIFTGSMNWLPNEDAMIYFGREVFARLGFVNGASLDWSLDIVGHAPSLAVRGLDGGRVRVTGSVEDVRPYMRGASIFVVPLLIGGGSRLKILEAFAMGVPVVSTSVGCEGLGVRDGRHLLVADTAEDFARAIARLGSSPALGRELTDHALRHVRENFSWAAIGRCLVEFYESTFFSNHNRSGAS